MVGGDEAWPSPQVTWLALELVVLPHGVRCAGVGAGRALQDDLCPLPGDAVEETESAWAGPGQSQVGWWRLSTWLPIPGQTRVRLQLWLWVEQEQVGAGPGVDQDCPPGWSGPGLPRGEQGDRTQAGVSRWEPPENVEYLPKAPYVLTILRGLKEVFMTCLGLSKLRTTGMLSQATRMPSARLAACRTIRPGPRKRELVGKLLPPGPRPQPWGRAEATPTAQLAPRGRGQSAGRPPGILGRGLCKQPPFPPSWGCFLRLMWKLSQDDCTRGWARVSLHGDGPAPLGTSWLGSGNKGLVLTSPGVHLPNAGVGWASWASSFCIFRTWSWRPPGPEGNKNPKAASSKQATLGTMVSQFRKLRFPLTMSTTCGTAQRTAAPPKTRVRLLPLRLPVLRPPHHHTATQRRLTDPHAQLPGLRAPGLSPEAHVGACAFA